MRAAQSEAEGEQLCRRREPGAGRTQAWPDYGEGGGARTVDDYNEVVMQFCFVCLFGVALPIIGAPPTQPPPPSF